MSWRPTLAPTALFAAFTLLSPGCGDDDAPAADGGGGRDGGPGFDAGGGGPDGGPGVDSGPGVDAGSGSAAFCGRVLFSEPFEDTDFGSRGWYDSLSGDLSTAEHVAGSTRSFECRFEEGATGCTGGAPGRVLFDASDAYCLRYWVKYSANYVGSGRTYHPHEFLVMTDVDPMYIGPAGTHLTTYIEQVGGVARLALQDLMNVDTGCILLNDDSIVGCSGSFASYPFTEMRSVAACNGLAGDVEGRDCFAFGGGWYSARFWDSPDRIFRDEAGPRYKNDWHLVEAYFQMNSITGGVGVPDGRIRYWIDGVVEISSDRILLRTAQHPAMRFNQLLIAPYIGDGSPVDQFMWVDDLEITARR